MVFVLLYDILMIEVQNCRSCTPLEVSWISLVQGLDHGPTVVKHPAAASQLSQKAGLSSYRHRDQGESVRNSDQNHRLLFANRLKKSIVSKPPRQNKYKVAVGESLFELSPVCTGLNEFWQISPQHLSGYLFFNQSKLGSFGI